jgi:hypothetical protein
MLHTQRAINQLDASGSHVPALGQATVNRKHKAAQGGFDVGGWANRLSNVDSNGSLRGSTMTAEYSRAGIVGVAVLVTLGPISPRSSRKTSALCSWRRSCSSPVTFERGWNAGASPRGSESRDEGGFAGRLKWTRNVQLIVLSSARHDASRETFLGLELRTVQTS